MRGDFGAFVRAAPVVQARLRILVPGQFGRRISPAAKAAIDLAAVGARLKPCPFKANPKLTQYQNLRSLPRKAAAAYADTSIAGKKLFRNQRTP